MICNILPSQTLLIQSVQRFSCVEAFIRCIMCIMAVSSCQINHLLHQFFILLSLFYFFLRMNQNRLKKSSAVGKWSETEKSFGSDVQSEVAKPIRQSIKEEL